MRNYIRRDPLAEVKGPFTVDELLVRLDSGEIVPENLASSDVGGRDEKLVKYRSCDWFLFSSIPVLRHLAPQELVQADAVIQRRWRTIDFILLPVVFGCGLVILVSWDFRVLVICGTIAWGSIRLMDQSEDP